MSKIEDGPAFGQWQPIETAPKTGISILICGGTYHYTAYLYPDELKYRGVKIASFYDGRWRGGYGAEYDEEYIHLPTHWMPLPEPPADAMIAARKGGSHG